MFKILSMALISLVGMQYANTSGDNLQGNIRATYSVVGGTDFSTFTDGFLIPSANASYYVLDTSVSDFPMYNYDMYFYFNCDYLYFTHVQSGVETMIDTRDLDYSSSITKYSMQLYFPSNGDYHLYLRTYVGDTVMNTYVNTVVHSGDYSGLDRLYQNLDKYVLYIKGFEYLYTSYIATIMNGYHSYYSIRTFPLDIDTRYRSLERNYYFPYQPVVYGYWYKDQNSTFYIPNLGTVGTYSRPTIFKGYFKCNGEKFRSYRLDGTNNQQPSSGGWYFGKYNNVSSLSSAIRPSNGTQFWFASDGLFEYFNNGVKPVWYTQTTPVVSSNVEYNVISNTYQWYSFFYQNVYLVYEVVDTSGNLTSISDLSYYDMLSFNTGFISTETDINPLTNALTLVGVAFQQLWSIGNIVLFGTITINSLILLPILVSLVIFIIHLIKRG